MSQQAQQTAVVKAEAAPVGAKRPLPFVPNNMDDAWRIAEVLSRSDLLPDALKGKPSNVLVSVMTGAELGLSPMQSIREIYVVKGKGYVSALLKVALVRQSPDCLFWKMVESTEKVATFETQRRGDASPVRLSFTIEQAIRAGLARADGSRGDDNWSKYPALMLRRRCSSQLADEVYPDITKGIGIEDEVEEASSSQPFLSRLPVTSAPPPPNQVAGFPEAEEATPAPGPAPEAAQAQPKAEPAQASPTPPLHEVLLAELPSVSTTAELDAITKRAKTLPQGPERAAVGAAINARRAELKGG